MLSRSPAKERTLSAFTFARSASSRRPWARCTRATRGGRVLRRWSSRLRYAANASSKLATASPNRPTSRTRTPELGPLPNPLCSRTRAGPADSTARPPRTVRPPSPACRHRGGSEPPLRLRRFSSKGRKQASEMSRRSNGIPRRSEVGRARNGMDIGMIGEKDTAFTDGTQENTHGCAGFGAHV